MMTKSPFTLPESRGKFRRDLYEKVAKIVEENSNHHSPYRAFGESTVGRWERSKDFEVSRAAVRR